MNRKILLLTFGVALLGGLVAGCSGGASSDESSTSTATPADKLKRPGPVGAAGGGAPAAGGQAQAAAADAGTLPEGK